MIRLRVRRSNTLNLEFDFNIKFEFTSGKTAQKSVHAKTYNMDGVLDDRARLLPRRVHGVERRHVGAGEDNAVATDLAAHRLLGNQPASVCCLDAIHFVWRDSFCLPLCLV